MNKTRVFSLVVASLAGAALLFAWHPWNHDEISPRYDFVKVEQGTLSANVSASGTLNALMTVQVGSQVSGQIREVLADFNTGVAPGQVIARLDPETFQSRVTQAEADLAAAESAVQVARSSLAMRQAEERKTHLALAEAERGLQRKRGLLAQGFISPAELDTTQTAVATAREQIHLGNADTGVALAQVDSARAAVRQRQAALQQARLDLARTVIRSPVGGVVVSRNIDAGQTVAASLQAPVLFTIAKDLKEMEVNIAVDEADIGRVKLGQKVRFNVDAFPGERFQGQVTQIRKAPQSSNNVVTFSVMARVANPDLKLLPGMTASARILTEERQNVLKVPNEALRFRPTLADGSPLKPEVRKREDGPGIPGRVWVPGPDGSPLARHLRLGVSDGRFTEVLAGEIKAGTAVIVSQRDATPPKPANRPFAGL